MNNINIVAVSGRLTKDSEVKVTNSGNSVLTFSIAVNESRKKGDKWEDYPNYIRVNYWSQYAEKMKASLVKGKAVSVAGSLRQNRWESKDGHQESEVYIFATNIEYVPEAIREAAPSSAGPESFNDDIPF